MTSNRPEFVAAVLGISRIGAAAVLVNAVWKRLEVEEALRLTRPRYAIGEDPGIALLAPLLGSDRCIDLDGSARTASRPTDPIGESDAGNGGGARDAVLVFSSGTTDRPKAVRHTHHSISVGIRHWCQALDLGHSDRFQVATPPSHILGLLNLLAALESGATVRLHRRFDLDEVLRRIHTERMTLEMVVAPIALALASHPDLEAFDLSSLRYFMWCATPVTSSVAESVTARTGVRWLAAYGASEVPVIAANPVRDPKAWRLDSVGLPVGDVALRVVDMDSGAVLPTGAVGEIQVRSRSAMAGYLPDEATDDAFMAGWYRTGDIGWLEPAGWVHLTDRWKEMIKVNGFQVAPAEIEEVLHRHPGVLDCAVFGVPDERAGEVPIAAVQLGVDSPATAEELERLVAESLAHYKRIRRVVFVQAIPRLPSGKVLRRVLREEFSGAS